MALDTTNMRPAIKRYLESFVFQNPGVMVEESRDGCAVLVYEKNFSRWERRLHRRIGGPKVIKRPLDEIGTYIWNLSADGASIKKICKKVDKKYREAIEPVIPRVVGFLRILEERNLAIIVRDEETMKKLLVEIDKENSSKAAGTSPPAEAEPSTEEEGGLCQDGCDPEKIGESDV